MNIFRQHDPEGEYVWNAFQEHNRSVPQISPQMLHRIVPGHFADCRADAFCRCRECKPPLTHPQKLRAVGLMSAALWLLPLAAVVALTGCTDPQPEPSDAPAYGILRTRLFQQCMVSAVNVTPTTVADRGSWSEVVEQCGSQAYYQANTCKDAKLCLDALNAKDAGK